MTQDDLLARIRKCLALARSANEHEAAAALAKARALMDEHGVDHADLAALDVWRTIARLYPQHETDAIVRAWLDRRYPGRTSLVPRDRSAGSVGENDRARGRVVGSAVTLAHGVATGPAALRLGGAA